MGRDAGRLYGGVALCAVIVHLGAFWNRWAFDDIPIIYYNPLVHALSGTWRAFVSPYWPRELGGQLYRPLTMASYAVDWRIGQVAWFHAMNVAWHAGASVLVAVLVRRWSGDRAALVSGLLFAVHPVHVEAVANIVGRAELMAALFALLAVYAALGCDRVGWSAAALVGGLLSKENAAVVPGLIVWGWMLGLARPSRRRMLGYAASWIAVAAAYAVTRETILNPLSRIENIAPVFVGAAPWAVRLTAVAAFADVARLLVFPLTLRVDYSPAERTLVTSPLDPRFVLGLLCLVALGGLIGLAWRRGRRVEAFGLGWIAIALLPVANLVFPVGVLVAERTLYLPSAGLALAAGAWLADLAPARWRVVAAALVVAGGVRTARRVPVWRDATSVILSELEDSPRSYDGPARMVGVYLSRRQPEKAIDAYRASTAIFDRFPWVYIWGADAAFGSGRPALADSMLRRLEQLCYRCGYYYRYEASGALARGDTATADSLLARAGEFREP
jgi:protein O-mannosyl-transferase